MQTQNETVPKILVVDDVAANLSLLSDALEPHGYNILAAPSGEVALKIVQRIIPDLILLDIMMPGMDGLETCRLLREQQRTCSIPVIFISAKDETESVVKGFRLGAVDYITKPFQTEEVLARVETHLKLHRLTNALQQKNSELEEEIQRRRKAETALIAADEQLSIVSRRESERWGINRFIGRSPLVARILEDVRRLQRFSSTNVLITGESGTGKELIARAIHFGGQRATGPFIPVNCSAIPRDLAESTFFGHVRGAFTGAAVGQKGLFEQAHNGTLFLDEIGDMPVPLQAKLLRVLEDGFIAPVGSAQTRKIDVRVLSGTNADLQSEIAAGRFRKDLYFRLARYTLEVPALRDRREDVPLLAEHFLAELATEMGMAKPEMTPEAATALSSYSYPGNIRELKNIIERALIESGGGSIMAHHLYFLPSIPKTAEIQNPLLSSSSPSPSRRRLSGEEERILEHVRQHGAINNTECRDLLGVGMQRACYLLRKLHLNGVLNRDSSGRWAQYRV